MKYKFFKLLLRQYTNTTTNIRAATGRNYNWLPEIPDNVANNIENIISFLQSKIEEGYFCKKDEFLMIYDGELLVSNNNLFVLSIVIRPIDQIDDLSNCTGSSLQLVVNSATGEIGNSCYGLSQLGFLTEEEGEEMSIVYGNYNFSSFEANYSANRYDELFKEEHISHDLCFSYQQQASILLKNTIDFVTSFDLKGNISYSSFLYAAMKMPYY